MQITLLKCFQHFLEVYILFYKNQKYKMNIYNSLDCCGWNTTIEEEQYDESRYLLCTIAQYYDEEKIIFNNISKTRKMYEFSKK